MTSNVLLPRQQRQLLLEGGILAGAGITRELHLLGFKVHIKEILQASLLVGTKGAWSDTE